MPDNNEQEQEVIIRLGTDTSDAAQGVQDLADQIDNLNDTTVDQPFRNLRQQLREANNEAQRMATQFGTNSQQFTAAAQRVAGLRDQVAEFSNQISSFNPDNSLQGLVQLSAGAVQGIQGIAGAMTLLGIESGTVEEGIARLQALMALSDSLNAIDDIRNAFSNFGQVVQATSVYQQLSNGYNIAATAIMNTLGISVNTTSTSFRVLKGVLAGLGIGLLVAGVVLLVQNFKDLTDSMRFASAEQKVLNETQEDYNKGVTEAIKKTTDVKVAFDLARQGTISKKEALQKYNDELGNTLGKAKSLDEAERLYNSKADVFIQIMGLKTQAQALFALSAKETANALLASTEDQTGFIDKTKAGIFSMFGMYGTAAKSAIAAQTEGVDAAVKTATDRANLTIKGGEELLKKMAELAKANNIKVDAIDNNKTETPKAKAPEKKKEEDEGKKFEEYLAGKQKQWNQEDESERIHYENQNTIDAERTEANRLKVEQDIANAIKAAEDKVNFSNAAAIEAKRKNEANEEDTGEEAKQKIFNILNAELLAEQEAFNLKQLQDASNKSKLEQNLQQHLANKQALEKAGAEAINKIDKLSVEQKKAALGQVGNLLGQAAELAGKHTVAGKALAVAQTGIQTFQSATSVFAGMTSQFPGPVGVALGVAGAAFAVASGIANIKKILATKVPGAAGGSGGSVPTIPSVQAPSITAAQTQTQEVQNVRVTNNTQQEPLRAYITNGDLQSNEQKKKFLNGISTF